MLGELAAIITALLWSGTSIAFTEASVRVGSFHVNISRLVIAFLLLVITIVVLGFDIKMSTNQIFNLGMSGFIGLVIGDTFLFKAFQYIGARVSMLIMALVPALSAIMAYIFLGEIILPVQVLGMIVTITGIAIVVLQRKDNKFKPDYRGIFYAFMGAVGQAGGLIFAKLAFNEADLNGFVATSVRIAASIIFIYPVFVIVNRNPNPFYKFVDNKKAFLYMLAGSVVGPYFGITFSLIAISNTKVGIASTLMAMPPIIMLPMVRYFYKEKIPLYSVIGAIIAVAGVALLFLA
ncbi:DMT family transporter [Melioribacter sp. OK-6-Me]|uniref:DMT family transporter n=1 Tax=unclassified Melioribacter TaxID=2627329 RepID=UPI003EDA5150